MTWNIVTVYSRVSCLSLLLLFAGLAANAQKLPNVQQLSLYAPSNIKIDGKASEWGNKFQAYNHQTDIFYTICNDDKNLYLTIRAEDQMAIMKVLDGGIGFTIQKALKKNDEKKAAIVYPVFGKYNKPLIGLRKPGAAVPPEEMVPEIADSIMRANNKKFENGAKLIKVTGIAGIDTLISVYNQEGIKAKGLFDNKRAFSYELAFPIKYLDILSGQNRFAYHIVIGSDNSSKTTADIEPLVFTSGVNADGTPASQATLDAMSARVNAIRQSINAPTDFWGEYTIAKK